LTLSAGQLTWQPVGIPRGQLHQFQQLLYARRMGALAAFHDPQRLRDRLADRHQGIEG
jgi:hypothetical protein